MSTDSIDCVIIGGGLAGMTTARRLQQLDVAAVVLEKGADDYGHNNARISGGLIHLAWRDMEEPADLLRENLTRETDGEIDPDIAQTLATNARRAIRWIAAEGVEMRPKGEQPYQQHALYPHRPGTGHRIGAEFGPDRMMRALYDNFRRDGGTIRLDSPAFALRSGGAERNWTVEYHGPTGEATVAADTVVVADGGFQGNAEMLTRYVGPSAPLCVLRAWPSATGEGLRMLLELGAGSSALGRVYGHMVSRDALYDDALWPYPAMDKLCLAGLLIDRQGRRFADDAATGVELVTKLAHSEDPRGYAVVFDDVLWDTAGRDNPYNTAVPNPDLRERGAHFVSGEDLETLAGHLGVTPTRLTAAVAAHNEQPGGVSIATGPYHAARVAPGITFTMGGVRIDRHAGVLDVDARRMPGLYAAGSTAGGVHGGPHGGYVGGLAVALELGLVAAEDIAGADADAGELQTTAAVP